MNRAKTKFVGFGILQTSEVSALALRLDDKGNLSGKRVRLPTKEAPMKGGAWTSLEPESENPGQEPNARRCPINNDPAREQAKALLDFFNAKTGRNYAHVEANLALIRARLREYSEEDVRSVIAVKCRQWRDDPKMSKYLRPITIFNATKFANYFGELVHAEKLNQETVVPFVPEKGCPF